MLSRGEVSARDDGPALVVPGYEVFEQRGSPLRWHGRRVGDGRSVALICLPTQGWDARSQQQALDVTAALSRVHHRHLLGLHDVIPDVRGPHGDVCLVIVTATIDGGSLMTTLAARGQLSAGEAVTALVPIGQALAAMHEEGHVHGWLAAEVVVFTAEGMPLLAPPWMDETQGGRESRQGDGCVAPEVMEGFEATPESDCYGYAALIWTTLTGEHPGWVGARGELEEVAPGTSPALSRAVSRALSPDPSQRAPMEELLRCLHGLARPTPIEMTAVDVARDVPGQIRAGARNADRAPGRRARSAARHRQPRSWTRAGVGAIALIMLLVGGAVAWTQLDSSTAQPDVVSMVAQGALPKTPKTPETPETAETPETDGNFLSQTADGIADRRALAIVQGLLDARAEAWIGGDVEQLADAHAIGSPAMAADTKRLRAATSSGDRLQDVRFTARGSMVLPMAPAASSVPELGGPERMASDAPTSFAMLLTVDREAVTVVAAGGQQTTVPAATDRVTVTVVRQAGVWRFFEWT
ncbi:MAG: protein kinase [Ornithinimicrobium sp.]